MTGLHPTGFPVPKTYGLCEAPEVLGSKFFVMSMADGRSLWNGAHCRGMEPSSTPRASIDALIDTMAELHLNKPDEIGLGSIMASRPITAPARSRAGPSNTSSLKPSMMPKMERLIEWLPETIPPQHGSSVVHGDYRLDNVIFHKTDRAAHNRGARLGTVHARRSDCRFQLSDAQLVPARGRARRAAGAGPWKRLAFLPLKKRSSGMLRAPAIRFRQWIGTLPIICSGSPALCRGSRSA